MIDCLIIKAIIENAISYHLVHIINLIEQRGPLIIYWLSIKQYVHNLDDVPNGFNTLFPMAAVKRESLGLQRRPYRRNLNITLRLATDYN